MRWKNAWVLIGLVIVASAGLVQLGGCGVPRVSRTIAASQHAGDVARLSDEEVRAKLREQASAWSSFEATLRRRELFGLPAVSEAFVDAVATARSAAQRQVELMDAGADDPAKNRAMLASFERLWRRAEMYLAR